MHHFDLPLVLDKDIMKRFIRPPNVPLTVYVESWLTNGASRYIEAYLPGKTEEERRDPMISPFFMNLNKLKVW